MRPFSLDEVRAVVHRLFIARAGTTLRKEDEQKSRELAGLLVRLARLRKGAHVVDAAAGKASVGLVAAELLPLGALTVVERDPARVEACRAAVARLTHAVPVDIRHADVGAPEAWPDGPDAVVALHACGPASDVVIERSIACKTKSLLLVPCCYGASLLFMARADAVVDAMGWVSDDLIRRRLRASLIDLERQLRLEEAGYETTLEELVGATVTPHNVLFHARRTRSEVRMERARARLASLRGEAASP